jgi:hypothetical protein
MKKPEAQYDNLEAQVYSLPSTSNAAMEEIVKGIYAGKPLFGAYRYP